MKYTITPTQNAHWIGSTEFGHRNIWLSVSELRQQWRNVDCRHDTIISMFVATDDGLASVNISLLQTLISNWNLKSSVRPNIYVPKPMGLGFDPINKINITFERRRDMNLAMNRGLFILHATNYSLLIDETFLTLNLGPALWCWSLHQVFTTQI